MTKSKGRFCFKQESNGNLIGEFSNNIDPEIYTESCDLIGQKENGVKFKGNYKSTWRDGEKPIYTELFIDLKNGNDRLFKLVWRTGDVVHFSGEGMLCDDILIGDYKEGEYD